MKTCRSRKRYIILPKRWAKVFRSGLATVDLDCTLVTWGSGVLVEFPNSATSRGVLAGFIAMYVTSRNRGSYTLCGGDPRTRWRKADR